MTEGWSTWSTGKGVCGGKEEVVGFLSLQKSKLSSILHQEHRARLFSEEYSRRMRDFGDRLEQ